MSRMDDTQARFMEIIQWYSYHKKNSGSADLRQQVKLLTDMVDNMFTLNTMMFRDMRMMEAKSKLARPNIVMPANMGPVIPFKRKFQ